MLELLRAVLPDALLDTAKMLPFLYLAYLAIEYAERRHGATIERLLAGGGKWGFVPGALLGCVPQCGFSAAAANLYASRVITPGALLAVFLATSDEAVPLLFSMPDRWGALAALLGVKLVYGILAGAALDLAFRKLLPGHLRGGYTGHANEVDCHTDHPAESSIWLAAVRHMLEIALFILLFSLLFGAVVEAAGEEAFAALLGGLGLAQPLVAALVGLVPNCAVSVLLTQLYADGAISFGSLTAGLCAGAGVGLAVLWRVNHSWKQNLFLTGVLWGCGSALGLVLQLLGM